MEPKFNTDRPKVSDEEINRHKDFDRLVKQFKARSLKQAQGDESRWRNKKTRYAAVIAGVTVICTVSYLSIVKNKKQNQTAHETLNTPAIHKALIKKPFISAPSEKIKIPYSAYKINNATGGSIVHTTSSKIKIPQNAFVNREGKDIVGEVTIEYREFHDAGDIVASGIPMAYDSSRTHYNLESAGMFDIKGTQNGQPVFIRPAKHIEVELASASDDKRFNQYFLDTVLKNWKYLNKDKVAAVKTPQEDAEHKAIKADQAPSPKLLALKNQVEVVIPKRIDSVRVIYVKKAAQLPKAKEPLKPNQPTQGRPSFKLDGSYDEFPELSAFDNVVFEVGPENTNYSKAFHDVTWSDVKISQGPVKGTNYLLNLSYRNRSEKLVVYPVLSGADYDKAEKIYEHKFSEYERLAEKRSAEEQRLMAEMQAKQQAYLAELKKKQEEYEKERQKNLSRYSSEQRNDLASSFNNMSNNTRAASFFRISQFGIYNSDCPHILEGGRPVTPVFVSENGSSVIPDQFYLVNHSIRSVYSLNGQNGFQFNYEPGHIYSICVFSKNKMYVCGKDGFKLGIQKGDYKFAIKILPEASENLIDFKKALEI